MQKLQSVQEAAEYLNLHPQTVRELARLKILKGRKTSPSSRGHWRFEKEALTAWARQHVALAAVSVKN